MARRAMAPRLRKSPSEMRKKGAAFTPSALAISLVIALSMNTAEAAISGEASGMPFSRRTPATVPSSPPIPWQQFRAQSTLQICRMRLPFTSHKKPSIKDARLHFFSGDSARNATMSNSCSPVYISPPCAM